MQAGNAGNPESGWPEELHKAAWPIEERYFSIID
jgi:hypothetical protein